MGKRSKKRKGTSVLLTIIIIILALLFIFSRTLRLSQRKVPMDTTENTIVPELDEKQEVQDKPAKTTIMSTTDQWPAKNILIGKPTARQRDSIMVPIPSTYANRTGMLMHRDAYKAFLDMHSAAESEGIALRIISAYRSFDHQTRIWENKWNGRQILHGNINALDISDPGERALEILRFSAMPGTSRHHWGTDIDLNSLNNDYFASGRGKQEYMWLRENAHKFGFCQPYTSNEQRGFTGYEEEKWHWSYKPVASVYLQAFKEQVDYSDIAGFDGWETAQQLNVITRYVLSINGECIIGDR